MIRDTTGRQALASVNRRIESKRRRRRIRQKLARFVARLDAAKGGGIEGTRSQETVRSATQEPKIARSARR